MNLNQMRTETYGEKMESKFKVGDIVKPKWAFSDLNNSMEPFKITRIRMHQIFGHPAKKGGGYIIESNLVLVKSAEAQPDENGNIGW